MIETEAMHCSLILTIGLLGESVIEELISSLLTTYSLSKLITSSEHSGFRYASKYLNCSNAVTENC